MTRAAIATSNSTSRYENKTFLTFFNKILDSKQRDREILILENENIFYQVTHEDGDGYKCSTITEMRLILKSFSEVGHHLLYELTRGDYDTRDVESSGNHSEKHHAKKLLNRKVEIVKLCHDGDHE